MSDGFDFSTEGASRRRAWRTVARKHPELFDGGGSSDLSAGDAGPTATATPTVTETKVSFKGAQEKTKKVFESPILALLALGLGAYLLWYAVKYWRGQGPAVWPSYVIKSVLQGKGIPPNQQAAASSAEVTAYEQQLGQQIAQSGSGGTGTNPSGPSGPGGPQPTGSAQNMAKMLLGRYGWSPSQMGPLILLWNRESGWRNCAYNPSGAYGIAQALGHGAGVGATGPRCDGASSPGFNTAYGGYGQAPKDSQAANAGSPLKQIEWGLNYIKQVYQSPSGAWAHEQQFGWY